MTKSSKLKLWPIYILIVGPFVLIGLLLLKIRSPEDFLYWCLGLGFAFLFWGGAYYFIFKRRFGLNYPVFGVSTSVIFATFLWYVLTNSELADFVLSTFMASQFFYLGKALEALVKHSQSNA